MIHSGKRILVIISLLLALGGCSGGEQDSAATATPGVQIAFIQQPAPAQEMMQALLIGRLVLHGPCLYVQTDTGERYLVVWPADVALNVQGQRIEIRRSGLVVGLVGEPITLVGGEIDRAWLQQGRNVRDLPPAQCDGLVWLAGEVGAP